MNVLVSSPFNMREQVEVANLLSHYISEAIQESTLRAHTMGAPLEEPTRQSSSKRGREQVCDTEDTATYPGYTQSGAPATVVPLPRLDLPATIVTEAPTPLQLREEARTAFLALPMLPESDLLELDHVSALLALLVDGEWGSTVVNLLTKQWPKKKATTIWKAWEPYLSHPPAHPTGATKVMTKMLRILNTAYTFPPAALEVATSIRDYAAAALTTAAFTEHTGITLEDDPVHVSDTRAMLPSALATSARH